MEKAPGALRTIAEVAEDLQLPQHVLRFWETRFPQIQPMKRGGGRRYYRPEDVDLLRAIRRLLYEEGYAIKGVQRILTERGAEHVAAFGQDGPLEDESGLAGLSDGKSAASEHTGRTPLAAFAMQELEASLQELELCRRLLDEDH